MNHKYKALLTPLRIGDVIVRTRMGMSKCNSQEQQGPENYPAEGTIRFIEDAAKNGASVISMPSVGLRNMDRDLEGDAALFPANNAFVNNYFVRMLDRVHAHGSLACIGMMCRLPDGQSFSDPNSARGPMPGGPPPGGGKKHKNEPMPIFDDFFSGLSGKDKNGNIKRGLSDRGSGGGRIRYTGPVRMITTEELQAYIQDRIADALELKTLNFDCIQLNAIGDTDARRNTRTDQYGGNLENRCRATTELLAGIKNACGTNFLIELQVQGSDDPEWVEMLKQWDPYVDIFHVRAAGGVGSHPSSYIYDEAEPLALRYTQKLKSAGFTAIIAAACGFQNPEYMEQALEAGKCDFIYLARPYNCDPDYFQKILAETPEDIIPCLRCDTCHSAYCAVNPRFGLENVFDGMFKAPSRVKKVAVIGGGPAGLRAAAVCAERGHKVDLYEKNAYLGGQMHHSDYVSGKWSMKNFKEWCIRQCKKNGVNIILNTEVTPAQIEAEGYDAVIAAPGSTPKRLSIPGGDQALHPIEVFGNEQTLGKKVVVVGGSMGAVDCAMYLADSGHDVTVITRRTMGYNLMSHSSGDVMNMLRRKYSNIEEISYAQIISVQNGIAVYQDEDDVLHEITYDSIVINAGVERRTDIAQTFFGCAPEFYIAGDASVPVDDGKGIPGLFIFGRAREANMKNANFTGFMAGMNI